jgi:hypothetical protein
LSSVGKKFKLFWFLCLALCFGKNQMCLNVRSAFLQWGTTVLSYTQAEILPLNFLRTTDFEFTAFLSYEARNPCLSISDVCALHEQSTPIRSFTKTSNMQIKGEKAKDRRVNFSRGWKSLACGLTLRNVSKLQAG